MGNGQQKSQNERFNPNFNMAEYNQRMNQMRNQYNHHSNLQAPGAYYGQRPVEQTMSCQEITRNVYIYKTTIEIHADVNGKVRVQFQYHSPNPARFDIALGVRRIQQNQVTKQTTNIDCIKGDSDGMNPGDKVKFSRTYELQRNMMSDLFKSGIMMKVSCNNEYSEYSLGYIPNTKLWKVLVQSYWRQGKHFGIQDIYGGGDEGQQCIVCFTQKSTTMVKPCNHLCLCNQCAKALQKQSNSCPICRKKIQSLVTIRTTNN